MKNTRTVNSIRNSMTSVISYVISIVIGFIAQSIFIKVLGVEYNGVKGLFTNILSMLNIAELGFGSAIVYRLYKPMAEEDIEQIKSLVKYYKNIYHVIAGVIFIIGIIMLPIIPQIVGNVSIPENIKFLFLLYLLSTVFSYLLTYKRSILYADQKSYITNLVNSIFVILKNIIQIWIMIVTKNFIIYLVAQILLVILENIVINMIVNVKYPFIKNLGNTPNVSQELRWDIKTKVKGLLFHKIGGFIVLGTDNIIISMTEGLGVITVGLYANYNMVIGQIKILFNNMISSLTASVGNLLIEKDKIKARNIYQSMLLLNSWIFCFCSISIYCMIEPFVKIWIGSEYVLPKFVLITLCINLYMQGMRNTSITFSDAAGIFYENRFVPLFEAIINMIASLFFVRIFGLAGVFIGTITSTLILFLYSYPKYVYRLILNGTYREYFKLHIKHSLLTLIICLFTAYLSNFITTSNAWLQLILNGMICLSIPNILYLLFAMKMPEFDFYKEKLKNIIKLKKR